MGRRFKTGFLPIFLALAAIKDVTSHDLSGYRKCPNTEDGWVFGPGNKDCFLLTPEKLTWPKARDYCASKGSSLATILNVEENDFIKSFYDVITYDDSQKPWGIWIGLYYKNLPLQAPLADGYVWVENDARPTYENWARFSARAREPNNWGGQGETVVDLWVTGKWNDNSRWRKWYAVCKKKYVAYTPTPCDSKTPNDGWVRKNNQADMCYYPLDFGSARSTAEDKCKEKGGFLVSIFSQEEENNVAEIGVKFLKSKKLWIGLQDTDDNLWSDYREGNYNKVGKCFTLDPKTLNWEDASCTEDHVAVCKRAKLKETVHQPCPGHAGWVKGLNDNYCYKLTDSKSSWLSAYTYCESNGATLASITSNDENDLALSFTDYNQRSLWFGLYNKDSSNFAWADGKTSNYRKWRSHSVPSLNEPNGQNEKPVSDCGLLLGAGTGGSYGFWKDDDCSKQAYGICKKELYKGPSGFTPCNDVTPNDGWHHRPNSIECYYVSPPSVKHAQAQGLCEAFGVSLTSIHSEAENTFIGSLKTIRSNSFFLWLGVNVLDNKTNVWYDGSDFDYNKWPGGDPNYEPGSKCIAMNTGQNGGLEWNAMACNQYSLHSVCKKERYNGPAGFKPCNELTPNDGWLLRPFSEDCYHVTTQSVKHDNAQSLCKNVGGNLTSIHSEAENDFVGSLKSIHSNTFFLWLGVKVLADKTNVWYDGSDFDYNNWPGGDPNYEPGSKCIAINTGQNGGLKWNAVACNQYTLYGVCKKQK